MNLLELAQKRCSIRKYAILPGGRRETGIYLGSRTYGSIGSQLPALVFRHNPARGRASKNTGMLCTRMVPIRTALHSRLRRPQPVVETFFGSERSYGHRCGNRHGTYQLSSR